MSTEATILLVSGAAVYALIAFSAFLIVLGRRAGWFGIAAAILATFYPIWAFLVGTGLIAALSPDAMGTMPDVGDMIAAVVGRLLPLLPIFMLPLGVLLYTYRRYHQSRQDEIFQVIAAAVESNVPLAPALRSYLLDRPAEGRTAWDAGLLLLCPPGYLVWTSRRTFDDRVAQLSALLAAGAPLPAALRMARGVASREVRVAAEVGDTAGRLAACLRRADRDRLAGVWLEVLPRVLYPLLLLIFIGGITTFLSLAIVPKFKKIFDDFKEPLPPVTQWVFTLMDNVGDYAWLLVLAVLGMFGVTAVLWASPTIRWHLPLVGRLFRWETQGLVLRMLGALFEVGRPAPEALKLLADAPDLPIIARRRLNKAQRAIERGEPLAESLGRAGLLPASMAPLVMAAERTHTLPFALGEIGNLLAGKAVGMAKRASLVIGPLLVVAIGALVGLIAIGMFTPLINILTRLARLSE